MEDLMTALLPQMPTVVVLLAVFWVLRQDVNRHMEYLEHLIEVLIDRMTTDPDQ